MLARDVEIGGRYRVRWHDGSFTIVRLIGTRRGYRSGRTQYSAINEKTGRLVVIKSAAKLRSRVDA